MEKDKVYISGAIAHYNIDERKGAFANAEQNLRNMGFSPVNPYDLGNDDYVATYLKEKGYEVTKKENNK